MTPPVYSNGFGKFLAGLLIPNSEIEDYLVLNCIITFLYDNVWRCPDMHLN